MNSTLLFSGFGKPKNSRKLFAKEEEEEVQEDKGNVVGVSRNSESMYGGWVSGG